jgi:hypothetical protein
MMAITTRSSTSVKPRDGLCIVAPSLAIYVELRIGSDITRRLKPSDLVKGSN